MRIKLFIFFTAMALFATACSFSFTTAKLASFNFGKNETATPPSTTFNVGEKVYAVAPVTGSMSKQKVRFKMTLVNVEGQPKNQDKGNTDVDLSGSGVATFFFTPPLPGEYKIDASLLDEDGKEIDKKSGTLKVTGSAPAAPSDDSKKDDKSDEDHDAPDHK